MGSCCQKAGASEVTKLELVDKKPSTNSQYSSRSSITDAQEGPQTAVKVISPLPKEAGGENDKDDQSRDKPPREDGSVNTLSVDSITASGQTKRKSSVRRSQSPDFDGFRGKEKSFSTTSVADLMKIPDFDDGEYESQIADNTILEDTNERDANGNEDSDIENGDFVGEPRYSFTGRFREDTSHFEFDDENKSSKLTAMLSDMNGAYTYGGNKMTEINEVTSQIDNVQHKLNLFFNPLLVRAILEIVHAKEIQIKSAFDREELDTPSYVKLTAALLDVKNTLAHRTNTNTVKTTRRLLRRTRTSGSIFEDVMSAQRKKRKSPLSPAVAEAKTDAARISNSISTASVSLSIGETHSRTPSSRGGSFIMKNLFEVCVNEAMGTMIRQTLLELVEDLKDEDSCSHAYNWISRLWDQCERAYQASDTPEVRHSKDMQALAALNRISALLESYLDRPSSTLRHIRSKIKQLCLTVEMVECSQLNKSRLVAAAII